MAYMECLVHTRTSSFLCTGLRQSATEFYVDTHQYPSVESLDDL